MFSKVSTSSSFGLLLISMVNVNELIVEMVLEFTNFETNSISLERLY
jgi:hypothetical protein